MLNELQLKAYYKILGHEGSYSQLHCQDVNKNTLVDRKLVSGLENVIAWAKAFNGLGNCFIGRATRNQSGDVGQSSILTLDLDPKREKGTAATESQWEKAIEAGRLVLRECGYGLLASSGNGTLLLFPLRGAVDKETGERLGKALEVIAREAIEAGGLKDVTSVDATWDAARLCKILGTTSTKGDKSLWRIARFIGPGTQNFTNYDAFISRLSKNQSAIPGGFQVPVVEKGTLDRSKADISLANRLKLQGFTAEDTYRALCANSFRPGNDVDYKRIVGKVYGSGAPVVSGREGIQLWTPANGMSDYTSRAQAGTPELPTGFTEIDKATFGLQRGHLFTVGARTSVGKTTFAVSVTRTLCGSGRRVLYISTESGFQEIWDRYFAVSTGISAFQIQNGLVPDAAKERLEQFKTEFNSHALIVPESFRPNLALITQAVEQAKPDVVVLDYFQHVEGREVKELEETVMGLKELAMKMNVAVLVCAMLHDGAVNPKTNKLYPPTLGHMKNCKVLNDESRIVILLDWDRDAGQGDGPVAVKAIMAKNKGSRNDCVLRLNRAVPRFENEV